MNSEESDTRRPMRRAGLIDQAVERFRDEVVSGRWPVGERIPTEVDLVSEFGGVTVLVVSHVTPIKTFLRLALDSGPSLLYRLHLDLASLSTAEFYPDGGSSVRLVNDTSHL